VALEPELVTGALAEQQRHPAGVAGHDRLPGQIPDRVRESRQRSAGDPVLALRPVDGQRTLPVHAAERL
jgi:hypothetical protein